MAIPCARKRVCGGENFGSALLQPVHNVCVSSECFSHYVCYGTIPQYINSIDILTICTHAKPYFSVVREQTSLLPPPLLFPRLRNDLYCVEWDVKLYYTIPYRCCFTWCQQYLGLLYESAALHSLGHGGSLSLKSGQADVVNVDQIMC